MGRYGIYNETTAYNQNLDYWKQLYDKWNTMYGEAAPALKTARDYFAVGGGYGYGQKRPATKKIQQGVAADTIAGVNTGMSSLSSARGLKTRAQDLQATQYRNIEDSRAQLGMQANSQYVNMMNSLGSILSGYPQNYPRPTPVQSSGGYGVSGISYHPDPWANNPIGKAKPRGGYGGGGYDPGGWGDRTQYSVNRGVNEYDYGAGTVSGYGDLPNYTEPYNPIGNDSFDWSTYE